MYGVILAAGMAKRLRPLTDTKPKCLLTVVGNASERSTGGRTLLERTVDAMLEAGVTEFVVVTGYRADQIRDFLTSKAPLSPPEGGTIDSPLKVNTIVAPSGAEGGASGSFTFLHNADYEHNNNIYSLWMAGQVVRGREFLLMDSDILCDPEAVLRIARQEGSALAVRRPVGQNALPWQNTDPLGEEEMKVVVDGEMRITEISKTCDPSTALGESVGIEKVSAEYSEALFRELDEMIEREGLIDIFYERAFERLIPQGHTFRVIDTTDLFSYEIDTPEDYDRAQKLMADSGCK